MRNVVPEYIGNMEAMEARRGVVLSGALFHIRARERSLRLCMWGPRVGSRYSKALV